MAALNPLPDLTTHPMLNPKSRQMAIESPTKFAEEVALAASLLHVNQTLYDAATTAGDGSMEALDRALVLQVNFRLSRGESAMYAQAESGQREGESKTYRGQDELVLSPEAVAIVEEVAGEVLEPESTADAGWGCGVTSLRGRGGSRYWWDRSGGSPDPSRPYIETRP